MKSTHIDENNKQDIRTHKYVPLIVLLFICIIVMIFVIGNIINQKFNQTDNLSKILPTKILAETVGEGINATFNSATGEVTISGTGTINKGNLIAYWDTIGKDAIISITFANISISRIL